MKRFVSRLKAACECFNALKQLSQDLLP